MPRTMSSKAIRRRRRRTTSKRRGGRVVLPSEYFGNASNSYTSNPLGGFETAYGESVAASRGNFTNKSTTQTCANLAPGCGFSGTCASSGIQTGGKRRQRRHSKSRARRRTTRRRTTRRRRQQRGGSGSYSRTVLPSKYYGTDSGVYTAPAGCQTFKTAYGDSVATGFGVSDASALGEGFVGPNLAAGGQTAATMTSGIQTGGGEVNVGKSKGGECEIIELVKNASGTTVHTPYWIGMCYKDNGEQHNFMLDDAEDFYYNDSNGKARGYKDISSKIKYYDREGTFKGQHQGKRFQIDNDEYWMPNDKTTKHLMEHFERIMHDQT